MRGWTREVISGAGEYDARMRSRDPETKCPVCAEDFGDDALVVCTGCETIHHRDCFEYNQQCGVYGCGGTLGRPRRLAGGRDPGLVEIQLVEVPGRAPTPTVDKPPWRGADATGSRRGRPRPRWGVSVPLSFVAGLVFLGLIGAVGKGGSSRSYGGRKRTKAEKVEYWRTQPWLVQVDGAHPRSIAQVHRQFFNHHSTRNWRPPGRYASEGCQMAVMDCDKEACAEQKGVLGYAPAMVTTARNYRSGTFWMRPSTRRSLYWYDRAFRHGETGVRDEIWEVASDPRLIEADPGGIEVVHHVSQYPIEPRRWLPEERLRADAEAGDPWAMVCLGLRAEQAAAEAALPSSLGPAVDWYERASAAGSEVARARLHGVYLRGMRGCSTPADLRSWAERMGEAGVARAAQDLR